MTIADLISIHAPREGSDQLYAGGQQPERALQSTLPVRGAALRLDHGDDIRSISIHAPREGSDTTQALYFHLSMHFNPRSP